MIEPFLSRIHDVTRYTISVKKTTKGLNDKIDLVNLLTMEALRVFRPEIFRRLPTLRNELTGIHDVTGGPNKRTQEDIEEMFNKTDREGA